MKYTQDEINVIFEAWRAIQKRPQLCRLTPNRKKLIQAVAEEGHPADDLATLMEYAGKSQDSIARWWRGENPDRKQYIGLDNLLRRTKLTDRVERALNWKLDMEEGVDDAPQTSQFPFRIVGGGK